MIGVAVGAAHNPFRALVTLKCVIADEAHRGQYDFIDGFTRHMRNALPNASFIGFTGTPRLCVEVKSEGGPIDRPTVDKLLGAVSKFSADEGLFVSWSGFKSNAQKELTASFFRVRLWTQKELLEQLFAHYDTIS